MTLYVTEGLAGIEVNHKTICHIVYPGVAVTQHKLQAIPTCVQVYSHSHLCITYCMGSSATRRLLALCSGLEPEGRRPEGSKPLQCQ